MIRNPARGHKLWQPPASLVAVGEVLSKLKAVAPGGRLEFHLNKLQKVTLSPREEKKLNGTKLKFIRLIRPHANQ